MHYTIRHVTKFTYEAPITESVMEVRMQPLSDGPQRCVRFGLSTTPTSRVKMYQDRDGNVVHHFNIPGRHSRLLLTAEALVEQIGTRELPDALDPEAWSRLDALTSTGGFWEVMTPSAFTAPTARLEELARSIGSERGRDPLSTVTRLSREIYEQFEYNTTSTRVDSPIDHALEARQGVCQDFAHILIALVRSLGVPCRYVSGYLHYDVDGGVRPTGGATHAWVEALMPDLGWVGLDPTNNLVAGPSHIRVAVGRDYADVPPTKGVFKGVSAVRSELAVAVTVGAGGAPAGGEQAPFFPWMSREAPGPPIDRDAAQQQQQ